MSRLGIKASIPHRFNDQLATWNAWIVAWKPEQLAQYIGALNGCPEGERSLASEKALLTAGLKTGGAISLR